MKPATTELQERLAEALRAILSEDGPIVGDGRRNEYVQQAEAALAEYDAKPDAWTSPLFVQWQNERGPFEQAERGFRQIARAIDEAAARLTKAAKDYDPDAPAQEITAEEREEAAREAFDYFATEYKEAFQP